MPCDKATAPVTESTAPPTKSFATRKRGTARPNSHRALGTSKFPKEVIQLYNAIKHGTNGRINHGAVAAALGINEPAARMRHIRLMRKIEAHLTTTKTSKVGTDKRRDVAETVAPEARK